MSLTQTITPTQLPSRHERTRNRVTITLMTKSPTINTVLKKDINTVNPIIDTVTNTSTEHAGESDRHFNTSRQHTAEFVVNFFGESDFLFLI